VLFVHGAGFRDRTLGLNYWGRIPGYFAQHGIAVYYGGTDAWGSVEENAKILEARLRRLVEHEGVEKVNIIAHSRGGLEARYLISGLGMDWAVASLTTVSTPHRGVKGMDLALRIPAGLYRFAAFFVNLWFRMLGDRRPDFFNSSRALSRLQCDEFNKKYPDRERVYYQSYAAKLKHCFGDPLFTLLNLYLKRTDGENDGLCPVESAAWGEYRGLITTGGIFGVSHAGAIDAYRVPCKGLAIPKLYLAMAEDLAALGC
jgi:triacylglycerol lipase